MASEKYDSRVFDKAQLIEVTIDEEDLMSFLVKMDIGDDGKPKYPEDELADWFFEFCQSMYSPGMKMLTYRTLWQRWQRRHSGYIRQTLTA